MSMVRSSRSLPAICLIAFLLAACLTAQSFAPLPGVRLWYTDSGGKATPIVLLHAATGTTDSWQKQIQPFTAAGYRVIAFDRRGWGKTEIDPAAQPGSASDDLHNLIMFLKIDRFHLLGTAAGGFVAIDYALSHPERLRSLVLAATIGGVTDEEYVALGRRLRPSQFDALPAELRELGPAYRASDKEGTEQWAALELSSRHGGPRSPAQPLKNKITYAALETIQSPTLLLSGGADMYAPPAAMQMLAKHIRKSLYVNVPDAGHSVNWEMPARFNAEVLKFIGKH